jgi:hypothetical protein
VLFFLAQFPLNFINLVRKTSRNLPTQNNKI